MSTLVTPSDLRARAKKLFERDARTWAAEQQTDDDQHDRDFHEREAALGALDPDVFHGGYSLMGP